MPFTSYLSSMIQPSFNVDDSQSVPLSGRTGVPSSASDKISGQKVINDGEITNVDYGLLEYLEGLFSSVGAEAEADRVYNSAEAAKSRQFNAEQAELQRNWEESMSNTAYTRAVTDLKRAGLNPLLVVDGMTSASTPSATAAQSSPASHSGSGGDSLSSILNSIAALISSSARTTSSTAALLKALKYIS